MMFIENSLAMPYVDYRCLRLFHKTLPDSSALWFATEFAMFIFFHKGQPCISDRRTRSGAIERLMLGSPLPPGQ
jgi:hypothetical protein